MELITADEARELRVNDSLKKIDAAIRDRAVSGATSVTYQLCCGPKVAQTIADRLRQNGFKVYGEDDWKVRGLLLILWGEEER